MAATAAPAVASTLFFTECLDGLLDGDGPRPAPEGHDVASVEAVERPVRVDLGFAHATTQTLALFVPCLPFLIRPILYSLFRIPPMLVSGTSGNASLIS